MTRSLSTFLLCGALAAQTHVCTIMDAGSSCATLDITITPLGNGGNNDLTLHASGLHPSAVGGMVWGMNPVNMPIFPGSPCLLLTDYVWGHYFQTDAAGEYTWSRSWPASFHGYFYMQMGSIIVDRNNIIEAITTSCKLVQCLLP